MDLRKLALVSLFTFGTLNAAAPVWANVGSAGTARAGSIQITRLTPADMAVDAAPASPLVVEFGGAVSPAFYQSVNLNLFYGSQPVEGELFYNPNARQVMFKPKIPLTAGKTFTAQVNFADPAGGNAEKAWSFRVKSPSVMGAAAPTTAFDASTLAAGTPDSAPAAGPRLSIVKANIGTGVLTKGNGMEITFSDPLDLGSLRDAPIKLFRGKELLGVDYKLSRDLKTITLVSRGALRPGTGYSVVVGNQLAGSSGSRMPKNTLIPFRIVDNDPAADVEVPLHVLEECPEEPSNSQAPQAPPYDMQQAHGSEEFDAAATIHAPRAQAPVPAVPLKIIALTPRNGETVANLNQPITVAFNSEIRPETLNEFTFRLEDDFGPVPAKIRYYQGRKQATLTPIGVLDSQKSYRIVLTNGVSDFAGRPMANAFSSSFVTGSAGQGFQGADAFAQAPVAAPARKVTTRRPTQARPVVAPDPMMDSHELEVVDDEAQAFGGQPQNSNQRASAAAGKAPARRERLSTFKVTAIKPTANGERVPRDSRIVVQFNEPVHPGTLNVVNLSIFGNQRRVEGRITYDAANRRATFIPAEKLNAETQYKVVLSDKVKSSAGEALAGRYTWQFTTEGERRGKYTPRMSVDADAEFSIPLLDRKPARRVNSGRPAPEPAGATSSGISYIAGNHWVMKGLRHMAAKGLLTNTAVLNGHAKVSRYECAMAVKNSLMNLKSMQSAAQKPKLRTNDLIQLEHLVIEFRSELRSFGADPAWFERFLQDQGINLGEIEQRVNALNAKG
jgi:hypothetical protein